MNLPTIKEHTWKYKASLFFQKYKHGLLLLYFLVYFPWFSWLERTVTNRFHIIHMTIDDFIPFVEYFIVPYLLWFVYVYPNGHHLRPTVFEHDNMFVDLVRILYKTDTPTNLFPSIHVYNSIGVNIAVWHSENFKQYKLLRIGSFFFMTSIILSTVFLKQHSVFDVITGIVFAVFMYTFVYSKSTVGVGASKTSLADHVRRV